MGVCIHYSGSLNDLALIDQISDELEDICKSMDWKYTRLNEDWNITEKVSYKHKKSGGIEIEGTLGLKGIVFKPHEQCESVYMLFDSVGKLHSVLTKLPDFEPIIWTKTQFAGPDVHIGIIKLFKYLKSKYIADLEVYDEAKYWENEDRDYLERCMNIINSGIEMLSELAENSKDTDDFLAKLENLFGDRISRIEIKKEKD
jgi:hypothetical protein